MDSGACISLAFTRSTPNPSTPISYTNRRPNRALKAQSTVIEAGFGARANLQPTRFAVRGTLLEKVFHPGHRARRGS